MGIKQVKDAFNLAGDGKVTADRAFLVYEHQSDVQMQVLRFVGSYADGSPMELKRTCPPHANLEAEAVAAVADALKAKEPTQ